jgi:hypothetical protein
MHMPGRLIDQVQETLRMRKKKGCSLGEIKMLEMKEAGKMSLFKAWEEHPAKIQD